MSKRDAASKDADQPSIGRPTLPAWGKLLLSALIALHIAAVVSGPLAFASNRGASPAAAAVRSFFLPYTSAFFLDQGYAFFAPDPGPNHLVDFKIEFDDGRPPAKGRFPDLATERPRLLYHRYFMLSEALNNRFAPPVFPPEPTPPSLTASAEEREHFAKIKLDYEQEKHRWQHARRQYEVMRASIENHLKQTHGGNRVTLTRIEHLPAEPDDVLYEHKPLGAPESYREMPETLPTGARR